jgi:hypothetical protein
MAAATGAPTATSSRNNHVIVHVTPIEKIDPEPGAKVWNFDELDDDNCVGGGATAG